MSDLVSVSVPVPTTSDDDPRLGHLIGKGCTAETAQVVIVGFPTDKGVRRNGGRPGAAEAPAAIRQALYKMTPDCEQYDESIALLRATCDLGDVVVSRDLEADQERLGAVLAPHLARGAVPIVLGGGHETAYGHFLAHVQAQRRVAILNWDAHPDVRPMDDSQGSSGTPFRQALEHPAGLCRSYTVAGLSPPSAARAHLDYLNERRATAYFNTSVNFSAIESIYAAHENDTMATFDLDAIDQASAPGVSAPTTAGLSPHIWLYAAYKAGSCSTVRSIDVVELNPQFDLDGRTARLAARTVWEFLRGLVSR
jgi:formiminoglutamase